MREIHEHELTPGSVISTLEKHKSEIKKYKVKKLGLFGSFLKGTQHKKSDMDFLVVFDKSTFDDYMDLKFLLEKIFNKKVDLVIENKLKPDLQYVKEEAVYAKGM